MASTENLLINWVLKYKDKRLLAQHNFGPGNLKKYEEHLTYILASQAIPSKNLFKAKFPDFRFNNVSREDIDELMKSCTSRIECHTLGVLMEIFGWNFISII